MKKIVLPAIIVMVLMIGCNQNSISSNYSTIDTGSDNIIIDSSNPSESCTFGERSNKAVLVEGSARSVDSEAVLLSQSMAVSEPEPDIKHPQISEDDDVGSSVENTRDETTQSSDYFVTFKITDSNGKPIPNVYISINPDTSAQRTTRYSNKNGVITYNFSKVGLGKHTIDIIEGFKIKKESRHEINIEKFPAEVNLIWNFGNPDEIKYIPESTSTLYFQYDNGNPVTGYLVLAAYNTCKDGVNIGFGMLEEVGTLNDKGLVVWNDPPKNIEVKLHIVDKDNHLRLYNMTTSSENGNTDYHFSWGDDSIKH